MLLLGYLITLLFPFIAGLCSTKSNELNEAIHQHVDRWEHKLKEHFNVVTDEWAVAEQAAMKDVDVWHQKRAASDPDLTTVERLLVILSNRSLSNISVITQIGDTNHSRAIRYGRGLYDEISAQELTAAAMDFYARTFGPAFNFTGQPYIPNLLNVGGYALPNGLLLPYILGLNDTNPFRPVYDYKVVFDSANLERGIKGNWRVFAAGNLVLVTATVNTSVGLVNASDVLGYADYNLVKLNAKDWSDPDNHETILVATPFASKQIPSIQFPGLTYNLSPVRVIDEDCNVGFGQLTTTFAGPKYSAMSPLRQYITGTMYWN